MPAPVVAVAVDVVVVAHQEHRVPQVRRALLAQRLESRRVVQLLVVHPAVRPAAHQAVVADLADVEAGHLVELRALRAEPPLALPVVHRQRQLLPQHRRRRVHPRQPRTASS